MKSLLQGHTARRLQSQDLKPSLPACRAHANHCMTLSLYWGDGQSYSGGAVQRLGRRFLVFFFLAVPHGMRDLSSLTRD